MKIEIYKEKKLLKLVDQENTTLLEAKVGIGKSGLGHKKVEGDGLTPEGTYEILVKNPKSVFNLSLGLSYPNRADAAQGLKDQSLSEEEYSEICTRLDSGQGTLWNTKLGGKIYIHGGLEEYESTQGCISLYKSELEKLYELVEIGTIVCISP